MKRNPVIWPEGCWLNPPFLHSDNGAPMTSYTLKARLADLSMLMSHSSPRVSNDNPYSESLFRTVKYCPAWPSKGFASLAAVCNWMLAFEEAYNEQHLHSGIQFVTPADRHRGIDHERLAHRKMVYEKAKRLNPRRWSGPTRNWEVTGPVSLNPGKVQELERNKLAGSHVFNEHEHPPAVCSVGKDDVERSMNVMNSRRTGFSRDETSGR